jgi:uncharacterized protein YcbX
MKTVGRIASVWRYPVKSMAGERLESTTVTLQGLLHDRWYAFVQQAGARDLFPWLTGREMPTILRYLPAWTGGERPQLVIRTPAGAEHAIDSPNLLAELERESGRASFLVPNYRGNFDVAAITFMSQATCDGIAEASGATADPGRFRMNFYVETEDRTPFNEDAWVGRVVRVGDSVRVAVTERDKRCQMVTLAPHGGPPATPVLTAIANLNGSYAGVYGSVLTPGEVREGDEVALED